MPQLSLSQQIFIQSPSSFSFWEPMPRSEIGCGPQAWPEPKSLIGVTLLRTLLRSTSRQPGTFSKRDKLNYPIAKRRPGPNQACSYIFEVTGRAHRSSFSTVYSDRWRTGTQLVNGWALDSKFSPSTSETTDNLPTARKWITS